MSKVYKIHPAIGYARLGNHPTAFFVGPEMPGAPGKEIGDDNSETDVKLYKSNGLIKRHAARFRVYEYEIDEMGKVTVVGEVNSDRARIEWTVDLANRKAALDHSPAPEHPAGPRNTTVTDRSTLIIRDSQPHSISGTDQRGSEFHGLFMGKDVYLGEIRTDSVGRLLVLGGRGVSESVPPGEDLPEFANNDKWHDDVSDGPVTATIAFAGQAPIAVQPAWVVVAPPDFAPGISGIVTLYEVVLQAAIEKGGLTAKVKPSFSRDIRPIIERAVNLRWVNEWSRWNALLPLDWTALADTTNSSMALRNKIGKKLRQPGLDHFVVPKYLDKYIQQWINGDFVSDLNTPVPPDSDPTNLDSSALLACVGSGFYPGIESSITLGDKDIYIDSFRFDQTNAKVFPGFLTEIMAVPWQADFNDCSGGVWWPSQRPDIAMLEGNNIPGSQADWANPISSHQAMVEDAQRLGFVVPQQVGQETVFVEAERDPTFTRV